MINSREMYRNFPPYETTSLESGILFLSKPGITTLHSDFRKTFISTLSTKSPMQLGQPLGVGQRADKGLIRKIELGEDIVVFKKTRYTRKEMGEDEKFTRELHKILGSPYIQLDNHFGITERYTSKYPEDPITVENVIGVYARNIQEKAISDREYWNIFNYYPQVLPFSAETKSESYKSETKRMDDQAARLRKMGYINVQFLITGSDDNGFQGIIIDTEMA